jgi:hypothetical protein
MSTHYVLPSLDLGKGFCEDANTSFDDRVLLSDFLTEYLHVLMKNEKKKYNKVKYGDVVSFEDYKGERNANLFFVDVDEEDDALILRPFGFTYDEYGNLPSNAKVLDPTYDLPLDYFDKVRCHNTLVWLYADDDRIDELNENKDTFEHKGKKYTVKLPKDVKYKDYPNYLEALPVEKVEGNTLYLAKPVKEYDDLVGSYDESTLYHYTERANIQTVKDIMVARSALIRRLAGIEKRE